jgi:hypothetical protein
VPYIGLSPAPLLDGQIFIMSEYIKNGTSGLRPPILLIMETGLLEPLSLCSLKTDKDKQSKLGAPCMGEVCLQSMQALPQMELGMRSLSPNPLEAPLKHPHHRQGLIWSPTDISFSLPAHSTEYADPIPMPSETRFVSHCDAHQC